MMFHSSTTFLWKMHTHQIDLKRKLKKKTILKSINFEWEFRGHDKFPISLTFVCACIHCEIDKDDTQRFFEAHDNGL